MNTGLVLRNGSRFSNGPDAKYQVPAEREPLNTSIWILTVHVKESATKATCFIKK
jgi:hypothetical protein